MKYLKYFKTDVDCQNYFSSDEFVTPNVSYVEGSDTMYCKPYVEQETGDLIIMTSESNPEVMKVCYNQGWAASPYEMHASEAARVTSIGTAFQGLGRNSGGYGYNNYSSGNNYSGGSTSFTFSFDEFKYFTGVTSIDNKAFFGSNIVSINIPNSVTSMGSNAFGGCDSLPVENNLRYADTYLVKVSDTSLSTYTIKEGTKWIGTYAFSGCKGLTSINIPDSVTSIGDNAFYGCISLTSITIPDSVTSIGFNAFYECSGLTSINIPNSVTSMGSNAFGGCDSLPVEDNLRYADTYLVGAVDKSLSTYTIKEGTKWIGTNAFSGCKGLTSINIPDSVTSIGDNAFYGCISLTSITIPDSVTSIDYNTFYSCDSLPVENGLRYADTYLVKAVDKSLSTYTIKEGTKWMGNSAFYGCKGLTSINIPDSVTSIGNNAFYECSKLTSITIGNSVTSIGNNALYECSMLDNITCLATTAPSIDTYVFQNIKQNGTLRYPSGSDYSSWMSTSSYYLGYYHWTTEEI